MYFRLSRAEYKKRREKCRKRLFEDEVGEEVEEVEEVGEEEVDEEEDVEDKKRK